MEVIQVTGQAPRFGEVAALFEDYRRHYGGGPAPDRSSEWLRQRIDAGELRVWTALREHRVCGLVTVAVLPASIGLGAFAAVRDVYVTPEARRGGVARALLTQVVDHARAAGLTRVSLQTEVTNDGARRLYEGLGFGVVDGLVSMSRPLP